MPVIEVSTEVRARAATVFDLARDMDLHARSMRRYREAAVGGVSSGLIGPGEQVTWRARHFGLPLTLTSQITVYDPPRHFRDSMLEGPFARFDHDHRFEERDGVTVMTDVFDYDLPLDGVGAIADRLFVRRRLCSLLAERQRAVKEAAEARRELD